MKFIKKQGLGTWISLATIIIALIALIIYSSALSAGTGLVIANGSEEFFEITREPDVAMMSAVPLCGILAIVFIVVAIVLSELPFKGIVGKVCGIVANALRIVAPALIVVAFLNFVYGSFTGLGWTFFSNEELEIYSEAIAVGQQVIVGIVFFIIAAVISAVAAFFKVCKEETAEA